MCIDLLHEISKTYCETCATGSLLLVVYSETSPGTVFTTHALKGHIQNPDVIYFVGPLWFSDIAIGGTGGGRHTSSKGSHAPNVPLPPPNETLGIKKIMHKHTFYG